MKINAVTHGALRILMACGDGQPVTRPEIAARLGFSEASITKSCNALVHAGLLVGRRGRGGGYRLARPAEDIPVLAVIDIFEADGPLFACRFRDSETCRITRVCKLRRACEAANLALRAELETISVADFALDHRDDLAAGHS